MSKIVIETEYPYAPELVWDALTDSAALKQWLMDNDFVAQVGHRFQFRAKPNKHWRGVVDAEVLAVEPPTRLSYSWQGDEDKPATVVTWTLRRAGQGTHLTLEHTGFTGIGGFILSRLILGPGWKKLMTKLLPVVIAHVSRAGLRFEPGRWLNPEKAEHSPDGPPGLSAAGSSS